MIAIIRVPATTALPTGLNTPIATPKKSAASNARIKKINEGEISSLIVSHLRGICATFFIMFVFLLPQCQSYFLYSTRHILLLFYFHVVHLSRCQTGLA